MDASAPALSKEISGSVTGGGGRMEEADEEGESDAGLANKGALALSYAVY